MGVLVCAGHQETRGLESRSRMHDLRNDDACFFVVCRRSTEDAETALGVVSADDSNLFAEELVDATRFGTRSFLWCESFSRPSLLGREFLTIFDLFDFEVRNPLRQEIQCCFDMQTDPGVCQDRMSAEQTGG